MSRAFGHSSALDRLSRMRPGERLEIGSSEPMQTLQELLTRRGMAGAFGWAYVEEGPQRWRAEMTRRSG